MDSITQSLMTGLSLGMERKRMARQKAQDELANSQIRKHMELTELQREDLARKLRTQKDVSEAVRGLIYPAMTPEYLKREPNVSVNWNTFSETYPFQVEKIPVQDSPKLTWDALSRVYAQYYPEEFMKESADLKKSQITQEGLLNRLAERFQFQEKLEDIREEHREELAGIKEKYRDENNRLLNEKREDELIEKKWEIALGGVLPEKTLNASATSLINPYTSQRFKTPQEYADAHARFVSEQRATPKTSVKSKTAASGEDWVKNVLKKTRGK